MAFQHLRRFLDKAKASGSTVVDIKDVEELLDIEETEISIEIKNIKLEQQRESDYQQSREQDFSKSQLENFKSIITMGQNALKSIIMINGGASVAFIAFLNNNLSHFLSDAVLSAVYSSLWCALIAFGLGTFLASLGYGLAYLTQQQYYKDDVALIAMTRQCAFEGKQINVSTKISWLHWGTIGCCIVSHVAFFLGLCFCGYGFYRVF